GVHPQQFLRLRRDQRRAGLPARELSPYPLPACPSRFAAGFPPTSLERRAMSSLFRRCTAEAIGTFAPLFIGAGSIMSGFFPKSDFGVFGVALAHGLILGTMVTVTMRISGGHLTPAVPLGLLVARRTDVRTAVAYIVTQVLAAIVAAAVLKALYPPAVLRAQGLGHPHTGGPIRQ